MRIFKVLQEKFFGSSEEVVTIQEGTKTIQVPRADKNLPEGLRIDGFVTIPDDSLLIYEVLESTLGVLEEDNKIHALSSIEIDEDCKVYRAYLGPIQDPMSNFILCTEFKSKSNYIEKLLFTPVYIYHPQTVDEWKKILGPEGIGAYTFIDIKNNSFTRCTNPELIKYEEPFKVIEEGITNPAGSEGWKAELISCMYSRELSSDMPEYLLIESVEFKSLSNKKMLHTFVRYAVGIPLPTDVKFVKPRS